MPLAILSGMTVIRYRVYCQHIAPSLVARAGFDGFTILNTRGFWKGKAEASHVVEILACGSDRNRVLTLCATIREQYRQEEVWFTAEEVLLTRVTIDATKEGF